MKEDKQNKLRELPSVSRFLASAAGAGLSSDFGEGLVKLQLRLELEKFRKRLNEDPETPVPGEKDLEQRIRRVLAAAAHPLGRRAINATGILLHPELRSVPLADEAVEEMAVAARDYTSLEQQTQTAEEHA